MKTTLMLIAIAALAAGNVGAQEGKENCPSHKENAWNQGNDDRQDWGQNRDRGGPERRGPMDKRGGGDQLRGSMSPEEMDQMRADHRAIKELGESARAETDPAKKAEIVAQLRAKLADVGARQLANQEKRLVQAEERLADLKAKIEYSKANREAMLDEQVQRVLAGERPMRPDRFKDFPNAKAGMPPPPPPPMGDDMDDDMPPPPAE